MILPIRGSGKGRQPPPGSSLWGFKLVSSLTCCQAHTCRKSATSLLLSSLSKLNAWSMEVLWNSDLTFHFKWFNFDSETSSGNRSKSIIYQLGIIHSRMYPVWPQWHHSVIHTKVAAILLDETLSLTPWQEVKLLAQWRPWCSELLQNAWDWFTNVDTFWATEQLNSW